MNQVDRRPRERLRPEELALLKTCGSEIRKTDQEALDMALSKGVRSTRSTQRFFKVRWTISVLSKSLARRTWELLKADEAYVRRRLGL